MLKVSKKWSASKEFTQTKKLCPHCGHDDFRVIRSKLSWILGEKFKCSKCGGTFKKANLVRVKGISTEGDVKREGTPRKPIRHQRNKRH